MIKRLYLANGTLQVPLSKSSEDISIDAVLGAYILSILGIGDWAYLTINWLDAYEVVKVTYDYTGLHVVRGQDGTCRQAFPMGSKVVYGVTEAEINDATPVNPAPYIYATGYGVATVQQNGYAFTVEYPDVVPTYVGGVTGYYTDGVWNLADYYPPAGCCTVAGNGAPLIPGPFFYFTSQLYAVDVLESGIQPGPNPNDPRNQNFSFGNLWLLTQPNVIDPNMVQSIPDLIQINVFGGQQAFTTTEQYVEAMYAVFLEVNVHGGQKAFTSVDSSYIASNNYILQANLFGNVVEYNNGVEKYISTSAYISGATLS